VSRGFWYDERVEPTAVILLGVFMVLCLLGAVALIFWVVTQVVIALAGLG